MHVIGCTRINSFHVTLITGRKRVYSGDIYLLTHSKHTQHVHRVYCERSTNSLAAPTTNYDRLSDTVTIIIIRIQLKILKILMLDNR